MERRIFGIENEYGVTCTFRGRRRLSPDEVARYLFRRVVAWGRSSNVFLRNGSRLYLDVGSHPEYATAECDDLIELVEQDRAGERILEGLMIEAQERLRADGIEGEIYLFKNNTDSAGNSYGCHENFLISRKDDLSALTDSFIPFLVTRQIICGAGKVHQSHRGSSFSLIVGDSNMSETTTLLKVGSADLVLRMIEADFPMRDMTLENPIRAIREISQDISGRRLVRLANGRELSALDIQAEYLMRVNDFVDRYGYHTPTVDRVLDLWERVLKAMDSDDYSLVEREIDWVIKYKLLDRYRSQRGLTWSDPRMAQLDLAYHDIRRDRGLFYMLEANGSVARVTRDLDVFRAKTFPPQTTRAKLRGDFIAKAQAHNRDFTVDWVHLKLNDNTQRTILCKDPFRSVDERVDRIMESM